MISNRGYISPPNSPSTSMSFPLPLPRSTDPAGPAGRFSLCGSSSRSTSEMFPSMSMAVDIMATEKSRTAMNTAAF